MLSAPTWQALDSPVIEADCIEAMRAMPSASVDAMVTDPPYGIRFMGQAWDGAAIEDAARARSGQAQPRHKDGSARANPRLSLAEEAGRYNLSQTANQAFQLWTETWATEALRILRPGGHLLAFGGTRTYHRLTAGIEDAGFEIRDCLLWLFGSGFPKSLDVSKAIDKAAGAEREDLGESPTHHGGGTNNVYAQDEWTKENFSRKARITAPATPEAAQWEGWGTALKPSHEPIVVARKPPIGTVAANVLEHGTGALNIDGCRTAMSETDREAIENMGGYGTAEYARRPSSTYQANQDGSLMPNVDARAHSAGRWPANVVLSHTPLCEPVGTRIVKGDPRETGDGERPSGFADVGAESGSGEPNAVVYGDEEVIEWDCVPGCPAAALDAQTADLKRQGNLRHGKPDPTGATSQVPNASPQPVCGYGDSGGASRFFYQAKTSRGERNAGLEGFEEKEPPGSKRSKPAPGRQSALGAPRANGHPTVKPINLMRWLVRLVTPPGGLVLDPFAGSGSTGCAAALEGVAFAGIEREPDYVEIARARIAFWERHQGREIADVLGLHATSQLEPERPLSHFTDWEAA